MVRTLTANAQAKVDTIKGVEPIIIVKVEWPSGDVYYADKAITVGAIVAVAAILDMGGVNSQVKVDSLGQVGSVNITLDDSDGTLKTLVDQELLEGVDCTVLQHFTGDDEADLLTLLKGVVAADVIWDEGERSLAFNIETAINDNEIGFAPEEGDLTNLHPDAVGVPWPIGFGNPIRIPTIPVRQQIRGTIKEPVAHTSPASFGIEGGQLFPSGSISIFIGGILFTGSFDGEEFTPTSRNDAIETSLAIASRVAGAWINDPSVLWLDDSTKNIVGQYCEVTKGGGTFVNKCISQTGTRCHFQKDWMEDLVIDGEVTTELLTSGDTISETAGYPRGSWGSTYREYNWIWEETDEYKQNWSRIIGFQEVKIVQDAYLLPEGTPVIYDGGFNDLYVANLIISSSILDVFGHRTVDGETKLEPIPSSYYTVDLNNLLAGQNCTTFEFETPLIDRECEGWAGDVFVSLVSTADQNVSNIIKWILQTYTSLVVDATTFDSVRNILRSAGNEKYPANFAIFDQPGAIAVCERIAWQSRCALVIDGGTAFLKYLSEVPTKDYTADESTIEMKTLELGFTPTEEIITKTTAKWKIDLSGEEDTEKEFIYKNNVATYGSVEEDIDFFIYNIESLVQLSAAFWGYRRSNVWRKGAFQSFLPAIILQPFDTVEHDLNILSDNLLRGDVRQSNYDSARPSIGLETVIASKAGDESGGEPIEDTKYWTGDPSYSINGNPVPTDPSTGLAEVDYTVDTDLDCLNSNVPQRADVAPDPVDTTDYKLVWRKPPSKTPRATNFALELHLVDKDGNQVSRTITAEITEETTDAADSSNITGTVTLQNGVWTVATAQVTGGSGDKAITFVATATDKRYGDIGTGIRLYDGTDIVLVVPRGVKRATDFDISGTGPANETGIPITVAGTDANDVVNNATISFDGSGNLVETTGWQVTGGTGKQSLEIIATFGGNTNVTNPIAVVDDDEDLIGVSGAIGNGIPVIDSKAGTVGTSISALREDTKPGILLRGAAADRDTTDDEDPSIRFTVDGSTKKGLEVIVSPDSDNQLAQRNNGLFVTAAAASSLPAGSRIGFCGASVPSGWLLCDGSVKVQATYAALFAAIGTTYNTGGEGAGNFRLPQYGNRFARGNTRIETIAGSADTHKHDLDGVVSGAEAAHTHPGGNHFHVIADSTNTNNDPFVADHGGGTDFQPYASGAGFRKSHTLTEHSHGISLNTEDESATTGAGSSHTHSFSVTDETSEENNIPKSTGEQFIIKT